MDAVGTPVTHPLRGLELTSGFSLHAERRTIVSEERWLSAGNDRVTLEFREASRLETFASYDASGSAALELPSDWAGQGQPAWTGPDRAQPSPFRFGIGLGRSETGNRPRMELPPGAPKGRDEECCAEEDRMSFKDRLTLLLLRKFFGYGEDVKVLDSRELQPDRENGAEAAQEFREATQPDTRSNVRQDRSSSSAWVDAGARRTTQVKEQVEFEAQLRASVDDGKGGAIEQRVTVKLRVSREFFRQEEWTVQAGERPQKDPLVLDLTGAGIDLTGVEDGTVFDLDADGKTERTATVRGGTGLLWLDRNGNGRLDDGRELFGDAGGAADGFEALAALDRNGDGRIDPADAQFQDLRLRLNVAGQARDISLEQAGVAALELQRVALPASLGEAASVDAVGVFRRMDGSLGLMADVRLAYEG